MKSLQDSSVIIIKVWQYFYFWTPNLGSKWVQCWCASVNILFSDQILIWWVLTGFPEESRLVKLEEKQTIWNIQTPIINVSSTPDGLADTTGSTSVTGLKDKAAMHIHGSQAEKISKAELHHLDTHSEHSCTAESCTRGNKAVPHRGWKTHTQISCADINPGNLRK